MAINTITEIDNFFNIDVQKNPSEIFDVLKKVLDFESAYIYLSNELTYSYNTKDKYTYSIKEELKIQNAPFGIIEITRNQKYNENERKIFKTCSSIIANLIKDIEISKIVNIQVKTLQEGILENNTAYKNEKSKNDFFANFSHELKTPLNAIISSSELLAERIFGQLNNKQEEYVNDIRISGLHLLGMINDILDMAKLDANSMQLNLTQFDISTTLEDVYNIINPLAIKKNIKIKKICNITDPITADRQKIQQIFFNLISNAIKYTPENGEISIKINKLKDATFISVKDTGIGIDEKFHEKIFQKFVQLGSQKHSNGLGLTITKELVKLHNGDIKLKSKLQQGSEFIVTIPDISCHWIRNMV